MFSIKSVLSKCQFLGRDKGKKQRFDKNNGKNIRQNEDYEERFFEKKSHPSFFMPKSKQNFVIGRKIANSFLRFKDIRF